MKSSMDANEFKRIRKSKGLTQADISAILGVSIVTIKSWENRRRNIPGVVNNFVRMSVVNCDSGKLKEIAAKLG